VLVVGGRPFGHWSEVLAAAAIARGITGLVIDGGVRDSVEPEELGFPVFSRGLAIRGTGKAFPGILGRPTWVGGVRVNTGDLVVGDTDGVVCLSSSQVRGILARADGASNTATGEHPRPSFVHKRSQNKNGGSARIHRLAWSGLLSLVAGTGFEPATSGL
jgi:regulator of RNase E activity RraA